MRDIIVKLLSDGEVQHVQNIYAEVASQLGENPQDPEFQHNVRGVISGLHQADILHHAGHGRWKMLSPTENAKILQERIMELDIAK